MMHALASFKAFSCIPASGQVYDHNHFLVRNTLPGFLACCRAGMAMGLINLNE